VRAEKAAVAHFVKRRKKEPMGRGPSGAKKYAGYSLCGAKKEKKDRERKTHRNGQGRRKTESMTRETQPSFRAKCNDALGKGENRGERGYGEGRKNIPEGPSGILSGGS